LPKTGGLTPRRRFQINLLSMLSIFGWLFNSATLYRAFGFYEPARPFIVGVSIIFQYVFSPYHTVLSFVMTSVSRQLEFRADAFAKNHGKGKTLASALIKLNNDNLGFPVYDSLYSTWHHNNPQLLERLEAIAKTDWSRGRWWFGANRFFGKYLRFPPALFSRFFLYIHTPARSSFRRSAGNTFCD